MKLKFDTQKLAQGLNLCRNVMPSSKILPFDDMITFEVKDTKCYLSASNAGRMDVTTACPVVSKSDCKFAVEGAKIHSLVTALDGHEIQIAVNKKTLSITQGTKKHRLRYVDSDFIDYNSSKYQTVDESLCIDLKGAMFEYALYNASRLVDENDVRPGFQGIGVKSYKDRGNVMVTGFQNEVSVFQFVDASYGDKFSEDINVIIPKQTASVLHSLGLVKDERVLMLMDGSSVVFKSEGITLYSNVMQGKVPKMVDQLLARYKEFPKANISRSALQGFINRSTSILSNQKGVTQTVTLKYTKEASIKVLGWDDNGWDNVSFQEIPCSENLDCPMHSYNVKFFRKPLDFIRNEEVKVAMAPDEKAMMFVSAVNQKINMQEFYMMAGLIKGSGVHEHVSELMDSFK